MIGATPGLFGLLFGDKTPIDPKLHSTTTLAALHQPSMAADQSWVFPNWISDLTVPDASSILPLVFAVQLFFRLGQGIPAYLSRKNNEPSPTLKVILTGVATAGAISGFAIAKGVPAGLVLLWVANGLTFGGQLNKLRARFGPQISERTVFITEAYEKLIRLLPKPVVEFLEKRARNKRRRRRFVPPTRTLNLSKRHVLFLSDNILPKQKKQK